MATLLGKISIAIGVCFCVVTITSAQEVVQPPNQPAVVKGNQVSNGQEASTPNKDDNNSSEGKKEVLVSEEEVTNTTTVSKVKTVTPVKIISPSGKQVSKDLVVSGPIFDIEQK